MTYILRDAVKSRALAIFPIYSAECRRSEKKTFLRSSAVFVIMLGCISDGQISNQISKTDNNKLGQRV